MNQTQTTTDMLNDAGREYYKRIEDMTQKEFEAECDRIVAMSVPDLITEMRSFGEPDEPPKEVGRYIEDVVARGTRAGGEQT